MSIWCYLFYNITKLYFQLETHSYCSNSCQISLKAKDGYIILHAPYNTCTPFNIYVMPVCHVLWFIWLFYWSWNWQRYEIVNGVIEVEGVSKESAAETPAEKSGDENPAEQKGEHSTCL